MRKITWLDFPDFTQEVVLDEDRYGLRFHWNSRGGFWTMSVLTTTQEPIVSGIKIVLGYNLLGRFRAYDVPPGDMIAIDPSGGTTRIEQNDFLTERCSLVYLTEAEIEAL